MSEEVDFLQAFFQKAIDQITENLRTMNDSKGRNRYASGVTAQEVGNPSNQQITEYAAKWVIQIYMPYYYDFIDEGVKGWANEKKTTGKFSFKKGNKPIPLAVIRQFMMNRGIVPKGYKGMKGNKPKIKDQLDSLARVIGRSIKKKGVEMFPFYSSVMTEDFFKSFETQFIDVYGDKILEDITFVFKNTK